jgi:hypothetical protein
MINLEKLTLEEILEVRVKDLNLEFTSEQKASFQKLFSKLKENNIAWRPHIWMSDEWFSPDGVSGFAIPFVLTHPKLIKLEALYLGECEGKNKVEFLKLCAHETGHAIDNAYKLRLNKQRQKLFGLTSTKYPSSYIPKSSSKDYITFLGDHYAQAHPDEDWAETFGYYLTNGTKPTRKHNMIVQDKLECLSTILKELDKKNHKENPNKTPMNFKNDLRTVRQYLFDKRKNLRKNRKNFYAPKIRNEFSSQDKTLQVHQFIAQNKSKLAKEVCLLTKQDIWTVTKSLNDLKDECKKKKYTLKYNHKRPFNQVKNILISHIDEYVQKGQTRIYM